MGVAGEQRRQLGRLLGAGAVQAAHEREAGLEHRRVVRLAALAALGGPAGLDQHRHDVGHHVEAVHHVGGFGQVAGDGAPVAGGHVGDHDTHAVAPGAGLAGQEAGQDLLRAPRQYRHHRPGLAVGDDGGEPAVALDQRLLVDAQDPTGDPAAAEEHSGGVVQHRGHHLVPAQAVAAGGGRHGGVRHLGHQRRPEAVGETPGDLGWDSVVARQPRHRKRRRARSLPAGSRASRLSAPPGGPGRRRPPENRRLRFVRRDGWPRRTRSPSPTRP